MPSLLDLFNLPKVTYSDLMKLGTSKRLTEAMKRYEPPKEPEWDIRSGLPEPGLGQVTPEEWLPPGMGTKLAALMGKGAVLAGAMKSAAKSKFNSPEDWFLPEIEAKLAASMRSAAKSGLSHDPAERAAAFLTAQRNAAKPVSEGGLGLRPDNTAQERASAMGFKGEGYHYSRAEDEVRELDPLNHPLGVKTAINEYGNVPSDFLATHVGTKDAALDRFSGLNEYLDDGDVVGATYPVLFKNNSPYKPSGFLMTDGEFSMIPESMFGMKSDSIPSKSKILKMRNELFANNSNIPYHNEYEHYGSLSHAVPPENIRSRFAAFDPAKRGDPDLLGYADPRLLGLIAGGTAGGVALNQLLQLNGAQR